MKLPRETHAVGKGPPGFRMLPCRHSWLLRRGHVSRFDAKRRQTDRTSMRLRQPWKGRLPLRSYYYYPPHRRIVQMNLAEAAACGNSYAQTQSGRGHGPGPIGGEEFSSMGTASCMPGTQPAARQRRLARGPGARARRIQSRRRGPLTQVRHISTGPRRLQCVDLEYRHAMRS